MTQQALTGFAAELRRASAEDHSAAESAGYIGGLLDGSLPVTAYAALSRQLHAVYAVLEEAGEVQRGRPVAGRFVFDELIRVPALEEDLTVLVGEGWRALPVLPETAAYVERLRDVAFGEPGGFIAHHYVRYMGDLSGGQFIGRGVERAYGLQDGAGARFYRFPGVPKPKLFKDAYRALLDEAPFWADERAAVVAEVKLAYRLNTGILTGLARRIA